MPKKTKPTTTVKVKDLAPRSGEAKDVKGGTRGDAVGPCNRK